MRLIDADEILKYKYEPDGCLYEVVDVDDILEAPTVAAAPEVHGKWVGYDVSYWRYSHSGGYPVNLIRYRCSVCGRTVCKKEPYCHCGAKMDGGK